MSTSIRLKNSSALVGGKAKVPVPTDLAQGELAVNTNKDDPSLFVKDSEGVVRKIAGSDATGIEGQYLSLAADAEAQTVATSETTTFTGQVDLPGGGNDTQALQKQEVEALIADPDGPADGNYLKLGAGTFDQTVASTGTTTFDGTVEAGDGINVTGGTAAATGNGIYYASGQQNLILATNGENQLYIDSTGNVAINSFANPNAQFSIQGQNTNTSAGTAGFGYYSIGQPSNSTQNYYHFYSLPTINASNSSLSSISHFYTEGITGDGKTTASAKGFHAEFNLSKSATDVKAFYSNIEPGASKFNFYAESAANNFFRGDTYIGGTAARNTRELWESTLTKEKKEQLAAGTLAIPANVSTPGDGSFVRQWWYDQQSAEDQALIDSGELDYPERYQAANFVDTFELGVDTNINLLSNGRGEFGGGVKVTGGSIKSDASRNWNFEQLILKNGQNPGAASNFGQFITKFATFGTTNDPENESSNFVNVPGFGVFYNSANTETATSVDLDASLVAFAPNGLAIRTNAPAQQRAVYIARANSDNVYAFYSDFRSSDDDAGHIHYNFYAEGAAPNYFEGDVRSKGRLRISSNPNLVTNDPGVGTNSGVWIYPEGAFSVGRAFSTQSSALMVFNRSGSINGRIIEFRNEGTRAGYIDLNGQSPADGVVFNAGNTATTAAAYTVASDRRLKTNIIDAPSAVDLVKALKPRQYDLAVSKNVRGFIADELQQVVPEAVHGTANAEEAIGTIYDFDGTVIETEVAEPPAEAQSYVTEEGETRVKSWIETGTRPVYQGVDQTKLIPLLTKALQEALDRIEQLEAQLGAGGGSDFESRVAALETDMARFKAI